MYKEISKLHYITQDLEAVSHVSLAEQACSGGMDWVQLRVKGQAYKEWLSIAAEVKVVCDKYHAKLIINDNVLIAREIGADGVHLGKQDMSTEKARMILGNNFIIGATANTSEDVRTLNKRRIDYIGLGPFRYTATKKNLSPAIGLEEIKEISSFSALPVIAIGGIQISDVESLMQTGVYGVAVASAINGSANRTKTAQQFTELLKLKYHAHA